MANGGSGAQHKSDFLTAEEIKGILSGRDRVEQERIIRWVQESLGLSISTTTVEMGKATQPESVPSQPAATTERQIDIKSFIQQKQPKSAVHFVTAIAYYYRFLAGEKERKDTVKSEDIQNAARQATGAGITGPVKTLINAMQLGYLDRAAKGEYCINAVGENLIAMALPGANADSGIKKKKQKPRLTSRKKSSKKPSRTNKKK